MSEKLLRQLIRQRLLEQTSPETMEPEGPLEPEDASILPNKAGQVFVVNIPRINRALTIVANVEGDATSDTGMTIDLTGIEDIEFTTDEMEGVAINAKRENAIFATLVEDIIENPSREDVGNLFERLSTTFPAMAANTNLPGEADYPFADLYWEGTYWSVKGTQSMTKKGIGSSMVKLGTLVTMLQQKKNPGAGPITSIGIVSGQVAGPGEISLVKYGPADVSFTKTAQPKKDDGTDDNGKNVSPWKAFITIAGTEVRFINKQFNDDGTYPAKKRKASWVLDPDFQKPSWITSKEVFSSADAEISIPFRGAGKPLLTVRYDPASVEESISATDYGAYQSAGTEVPGEDGEEPTIIPGRRTGAAGGDVPSLGKKDW